MILNIKTVRKIKLTRRTDGKYYLRYSLRKKEKCQKSFGISMKDYCGYIEIVV